MRESVAFDPAEALRMVLRVRLVERVLTRAWSDGRVPGEYHCGIGEEGIAVGVVSHLSDDDAVCADHRGTGPLVGRGVDLTALMVEVMGGQSGLNRGWAGHMHLMDPPRRASADGIVGSSAPMAVGQALAAEHLRPGACAVAFFGEGALNAGVVLEAINLAAVWSLPVLFVCKDNRWSITTKTSAVTAGDPRDRVRAMGVPVVTVRGDRVDDVHQASGRLLRRVRAGKGPAMLYATCHRPGGHLEGDPLLRIIRDPRGQTAELGPGILGGVRASAGGRHSERAAGVATIAARVGSSVVMGHGRDGRRDPLSHARRLVPSPLAEQIRTEEQRLVARAAQSAADAVAAVPSVDGVAP